jgi:hypothetical protein
LPDDPVPMSAQWAMIDDLVETYLGALKSQQWTTADIAMDLLAADKISDKRALAMIAATLFQRLAAIK